MADNSNGAPTGTDASSNEFDGFDSAQAHIDSWRERNADNGGALDLGHPLDTTAAADKYARSQRKGGY
jgi:hypothetical protein